ncbi:general secretion pathway protein GspB [Oceanicoccus sp. KOV_DT_Chl]|uniref:general secretion pathway protein GspB n=1 Tax=Oceanicoccus sp. KOV_DT_Chl TaxID=1904639 RepID=UPI000C7BBB1B|nr:general secretion pathway protein GspB [Oceanicoccus sp. KOV_DT_Chl]
MSLILDALNRADQERSEENNQINLHASHIPATAAHNPVRRWVIEAVLVTVAVAALVYSQWPQPIASPVIDDQAVPINNQASLPNPVTIIQEPSVPPISAKKTAAVSKNLSATTEADPKKERVVTAKISAEQKTIASLYQQQANPIVTPSAAKKVAKPIDNTQSILQQIPLLAQLSTRFQQTLPSMEYSVHMHAEGGKGFVTINGEMRKTGAIIEPGIRVIAILPDSVVLEFNNRQFRLPALNSWVNY